MFFNLVSNLKSRYICSVILKTIFLLKKKLIPIENWKMGLCEKLHFFCSILMLVNLLVQYSGTRYYLLRNVLLTLKERIWRTSLKNGFEERIWRTRLWQGSFFSMSYRLGLIWENRKLISLRTFIWCAE